MKKFLSLTALSASALVLAACGQAEHGGASGASLGVSNESSSSSQSAVSRELSTLRKLSSSSDSSYAIKMPASSVVDPAFAMNSTPTMAVKFKLGAQQDFLKQFEDVEKLPGFLLDGDPLKPHIQKLATEGRKALDEFADKPDAKRDFDPMGEKSPWAIAMKKAETLLRLRQAYAIAAQGTSAWEVSPTSQTNFMGPLTTTEQVILTGYERGHELGTCVASKLGANVAKRLSDYVLPDPDKAGDLAKKIAVEVMLSEGADVLAYCEKEYPEDAGRLTQLTGKEPGPSWIVTTASGARVHIECTSTGCKATRNGVVEFGEGKYLGATYELAMARSVGSSQERSSSGRQSESTDSSKSNGTKVGVGN